VHGDPGEGRAHVADASAALDQGQGRRLDRADDPRVLPGQRAPRTRAIVPNASGLNRWHLAGRGNAVVCKRRELFVVAEIAL
jgi:hypothetical protein